MIYVFDTSAFSQIFKNYYRPSFPSLWTNFDRLVVQGRITSTREVQRELEDSNIPEIKEWTKENCNVFPTPSLEEAKTVAQIFAKKRFQESIKLRKLLNGDKNADVFVGATVVSQENRRGGTGKIPTICNYFEISCRNVQEFMQYENWIF